MIGRILLLGMLLIFIGCVKRKNDEMIFISQDSARLISKQWREDSLGCDRLRDPKKIGQLIEQFELMGKDTSDLLVYLGPPNGRNYVGTDTIVFYYYMGCGVRQTSSYNFYCGFVGDKLSFVQSLVVN